jgi:undecaprenyl-diphosphatase
MTFLEAVLLGTVQGLFMFIPVSSTSHLALTQQWLLSRGSSLPPPDSPEMIFFDIVVHVGTLVSIAVVMRAGLGQLVTGIVDDLRRWRAGERAGLVNLKLAALGVVTVAITGVLGLLVRAYGTEAFARPALIAGALVATGAILWWTDTAGPQWRGARQLTVGVAVAIGLAQAAALLPGLSRSGLTIAMALLLGLRRPLAAQYSFFVAIPTILAAAAVQAATIGADPTGAFTLGLPAYAVGFVVAALVGAAALVLVLRLLYRAQFRVFAVYVWLLAGTVLVLRPTV